ncbi:GcvT family protein [Defluviimonas salinarum]|uniref:FAD-dependent oxidoreductase n=1 Tax=Defluviimonas salinarum TaxID=2992147 RepID=A0ABT3J276_9RHOB|nr:FAD-dependent oxidoreductase [Defluviimonas salinarum]MCW3781781.1 FAD-dependent oxidoreductase [Defluviimonas salinarum]
MRTQAKVVVIGGGAVGVSTLYHLARAGVTDTLLIEKSELTSGSTWHAAGNIPTYGTSWGGMRAGNYAWRLYKDLAGVVDYPITYRHTGAFWPAHTRDRMDFFHHLVGISRGLGYDMAMISPAEMEAMHPWYRAGSSVIGGILDPYEGDVDPSQLTQALAKGARDLGAEIVRFTKVTGISRRPSGEWQVSTDKGEVLCDVVVNASGYYGRQVGEMVGQRLPVVTLEHQYLVTEALPELEANPANFPLVRDPDIMFYLRRERNGLLLGSYGHAGRPAWLDGMPDDFANQLYPDSVDDIAEVLEAALEHIPILGEAGVSRFVNGPIPYSPDGAPLCGPAFGLPNFYHACCFPVGITHSAAAGKTLTEWITEGEPEWDMSAWDPRRFGDWATFDYTVARACELYEHQYAIPYPHRIWKSARPVNRTPLYDRLKAKGAVFGQIAGWERAFWFETETVKDDGCLSFRHEAWHDAVKAECEGVRDHIGVMDHGGFTRYEVEGPGATDFLDRVFCGAMPAVGRVKLSYMLTPKGKVWSEATIARLEEYRYLLCGPTLADQRDHDWMARFLPESGVTLRRGSDFDAALMVMGPKSRDTLQPLTDADLSKEAAPWMSVREITLAGAPMIALRVSYVGELGWELHMRSADLVTVYEAIMREGADKGMVEFGSYALNAMRIEKGYHGWGADFGIEYTPFDAGLERFVSRRKTDFVGRDAFLASADRPRDYHFTAFELDGQGPDALSSDPILKEGRVVGYVSSAGTGFRIGKRIALGYLTIPADPGDRLEIEVLGEPVQATVRALPFYDPENARLKG